GVEPGQLGVGDAKLYRADVALDRVDRLPGDQLLGPVQAQGGADPPAHSLQPDPSRQAPAPDVDPRQQHAALDLGELEVVDPNHPPAVHVHDLLVQDLAREPELAV